MADRLIKADTKEKFYEVVRRTDTMLVLVDFYATWCGPCKTIAPKLEEMLAEFSDLIVLKVDVDELAEVAEENNISAMPTFHLYKGGKKVDEMVGASEIKVKDLVNRYRS